MRFGFVFCLGLVAVGGIAGGETSITFLDPDGAAGRVGAPVCTSIQLSRDLIAAAQARGFELVEQDSNTRIPAQFIHLDDKTGKGEMMWLMPAGKAEKRLFLLRVASKEATPVTIDFEEATGACRVVDEGRPVLQYNYKIQELPRGFLDTVKESSRRYAQPRGDYIHPLFGPGGEILTRDWATDHPHHRGIYWAWPEVDFHAQRYDLHALQGVKAVPTGNLRYNEGPVFAQIEAESQWIWSDKTPIVRELALIRVYRSIGTMRFIDLMLSFTALADDVSLARRGTQAYGGLNIRLSGGKEQQIITHIDPAEMQPRRSWGDWSGVTEGRKDIVGLTVLENVSNPCYPGNWIQYPNLPWFQPAFPAKGTRYVLKRGKTLTLRYRLCVHAGRLQEAQLADLWSAYNRPFMAEQKSQ